MSLSREHGRILIRLIGALLCAMCVLCAQVGVGQLRSETVDQSTARPLSAHEAFASLRAGEDVRLFGYRLFDSPSFRRTVPVGRVGPDYRMGPGDRVRVVWQRLEETQDTELRVGIDATLLVPGLPPISVLDLTLAETGERLTRAADQSERGSRIAVSITGIREISVLVVGEVADPGLHQVPATASVLDALLAAGGVLRSGSLRSIRHVSSGGETAVDLYGLLLAGAVAGNPSVGQGDRVLVPPLGATIGVLGSVARPGLFELHPETEDFSVGQAIALAGGRIDPASLPFRLAAAESDREALTAVSVETEALEPGDLLILRGRAVAGGGGVRLAGAVTAPGRYRPEEVEEGLAGLLTAEAYPLMMIHQGRRRDGRVMRALQPSGAVSGLVDGDTLVILSRSDVAWLSRTAGHSAAGSGRIAMVCGDAPLAPVTAMTSAVERWRLLATAPAVQGRDAPCPAVFSRSPDLIPFLLNHAVLVLEGVDRPGLYPVTPGTGAMTVLREAGVSEAMGSELVHLTVPRASTVSPGDIIAARIATVSVVAPDGTEERRPLARVRSLRHLLSDQSLNTSTIYPLAAVLERSRSAGGGMTLFSPAEVLAGQQDIRLTDGDRVHFIPRASIPLTDPFGGMTQALRSLNAPLYEPLLHSATVRVEGAVVRAGAYPVAGPITVEPLIAAAGGRLPNADPVRLTVVTALADGPTPLSLSGATRSLAIVHPGDIIRVERLSSAANALVQVAVTGQIQVPGEYSLPAGSQLSDLLRAAGGLNNQAYPLGAALTRASAVEAEARYLSQAAERLRGQLAVLDLGPNSEAVVRSAHALLGEMERAEAHGRIVVLADPVQLQADPSADVILQSGDHLHVPSRPSTVSIRGAVAWPSAQRFETGYQFADYVRAAGGPIRNADQDRAFIVFPDGAAQPVRRNAGYHQFEAIPPGSMIIVPWRADGRGLLGLINEITTILARTAVTAAALSDLGDGN